MTMSKKGGPKLGWLLNTQKGLNVLKALVARERPQVSLVVSYDDPNTSENSLSEIESLCQQHDIAFESWSEFKRRGRLGIVERNLEGLVAVGWQYLLPEDYWRSLPNRLIVFHDSLLPRYRGFAPVATGMIKGDTEFGLSVLFAGEGIDDGDLILQKSMTIGKQAYMADAIDIIGQAYADAAVELCDRMDDGPVPSLPQDHGQATYSIWRGPEDCRIDWRQSAEEIRDLIRAVSSPLPGAFTLLGGAPLRVWRAELITEDLRFEIRDHGKIWSLDGGCPVIVCGSGLLKLTRITTEDGGEGLPITRLRQRFQ